jgi:glycosyltransferase involved in cell wall biosynthesis
MKKVLFISYHFPPIGASQRALKFVKYLPAFGWMPIVLAPASSDYPKVDRTLMNEIPKKSEIVRLPGCETFPGNPYVTVSDLMSGWYPAVIAEGLRLIEKRKIDVIYTVSAPYVSLLCGLALKRLTGKPLVVDLRDEWTTNPFIQGRRYAKDIAYNKILETRILSKADEVISVTNQITSTLFKLSGRKSSESFHTIPNGYDPSDFTHIGRMPRNVHFTISYMGSIYGLRKGIFDMFSQYLQAAIKKGILPSRDIRLRMIGYLDHVTFPPDWELNQITERTGYLDHKSALSAAASSDLLLLLVDPRETTTVTSKVYELINLGKPILALVPPKGPAAQVIHETGTGKIIDSSHPELAIPYIISLLEAWKKNSLKLNANLNAIQAYDRRRLTGKLADVLERSLSKKSEDE